MGFGLGPINLISNELPVIRLSFPMNFPQVPLMRDNSMLSYSEQAEYWFKNTGLQYIGYVTVCYAAGASAERAREMYACLHFSSQRIPQELEVARPGDLKTVLNTP